MMPSHLRARLLNGEWVIDEIAPKFREALIEGLTSTPVEREQLRGVASCYLSSAFYTDAPKELKPIAESKKLSSHEIEIIDADAKAPSFWQGAVQQVCAGEARLARIDELGSRSLENGFDRVVSHCPETKVSLSAMSHVAIFESSEWAASSQPHFFGCLFLSASLLNSSKLAETIVHELAHQEVFCLNLIDRLVDASADDKLIYAPFQEHDRPTIGRLHAAHALYRTCQYLEAVGSDQLLATTETLRLTLDTFTPGDLTELGQFLVDECYRPRCIQPEVIFARALKVE